MTSRPPDSPRPPDDHRHDHDCTDDVAREVDHFEEGLADPSDAAFRPTAGPTPGQIDGGRQPFAPPASRLTPDDRFRTGRLAGLTMNAAIWVLTWPILLESFLNATVGLTDTWLASQMGTAEADAIGGASYIMWFIGLCIMAVGIGATALISRSMGAGRRAVAQAVLGQATTLGLVLGTLVGTMIAVFAPWIAGVLNLEARAAEAFVIYMRIIGFGVPAASLLFVLIACARGAGDSVRPLQAMTVRNIVNVIVSWLASGVDVATASTGIDGEIVRTVWLTNPVGEAGIGIYGIALGTVAGDIAGALVILRTGLSGKWGITLLRKRLRPHLITMHRLIKLGVPNFFESLGMWLGNFAIVMMVGWMGAGLLGAHIIAIRLEAMSFLAGFAIGSAAATLAGQYLGAKRPDLARAAMLRCAIVASVIMGGLGVAFLLIPTLLVGLLSPEPLHLETTPTLMMICGAVQIPFAVGIVFRSGLRGAGDVRTVMALTWTSTYLIRLPLAFLLSGVDIATTGMVDGEPVTRMILENPMPDDSPIRGITGLWVGLCLDLLVRGVLFTGRFLQDGWTKRRI